MVVSLQVCKPEVTRSIGLRTGRKGHRVMQNISSRRSDETAGRHLAEAFSPETIDALLRDAKAPGTPVDGVNGFLNQMTKLCSSGPCRSR